MGSNPILSPFIGRELAEWPNAAHYVLSIYSLVKYNINNPQLCLSYFSSADVVVGSNPAVIRNMDDVAQR